MSKDFEIEAKVQNKTREQFAREGDDTFRIEFNNDNGFSGVIKISKKKPESSRAAKDVEAPEQS